MEISEGANTAEDKRRRVFFWFVCSALGGVCAREMYSHTPQQITDEVYKIAELMTQRWVERYGFDKTE